LKEGSLHIKSKIKALNKLKTKKEPTKLKFTWYIATCTPKAPKPCTKTFSLFKNSKRTPTHFKLGRIGLPFTC